MKKQTNDSSYEIIKLKKSVEIARKMISNNEEAIKDLKLGIKEMLSEIKKLEGKK